MTQAEIPNVLSIVKLLCDCDVLRQDCLGATLAQAASQNITAGQYLINTGKVERHVVRAAIMGHLLLNKRLVTYNLIIDALKSVTKDKLTFEEALGNLNWNHLFYDNLNKLKELLSSAGLVKEEELGLAFDIALRDKQPLIFILLKRGAISDLSADKILAVHERVMRDELSLEEAIKLLRKSEVSAGYLVTDNRGGAKSELKLSEILIGAELVAPDHLIAAIEKGYAENIPFGKILVRDYGLPEPTLVQAEFVQTLINKNFVTVYDGIQRLLSLTTNSSITGKDSDF